MTKKKKQHLIPECYLKSFTDPKPPQDVPESKYHPAVWVNEKSLKSEPTRKAPKNLLWKSYFYNLKDDNPEQPYIEEFLSKIESDFNNVLKTIENEKVFSAKELFVLAVFIDTLFRRTENQINYWEDKLDEIKNLYRQVNETYAERNEESREVAKRLIVEASGTIAKLVLQEGFNIVVNKSEAPFFTSDYPVSYSFMHIDDLHSHSIPENWTYKGIGTNERNFFCFCSLSPNYAFISSPFLKSKDEVPFYREIIDISFPIGVNLITRQMANEVIISSTPKPFIGFQNRIIESIEMAQKLYEPPENLLRIYTNRERYDLKVSKYERINEHPLKPKIKFWTKAISTVKSIASDKEIELIEFYEKGKEMGGTRNLKLSSVSTDPKAPSVLEADW